PGLEKPGILDSQGRIRDLSGVVEDIAGQAITPDGLKQIRPIDTDTLPLVEGDVRFGPCVGRVGKFICIGLNFADHAAESGLEPPSEPVIFMKATSAICGPNDTVLIPRDSV